MVSWKARSCSSSRFEVGVGQAEPDAAALRLDRADEQRDRFALVGRADARRFGHLGQHGRVRRGDLVACIRPAPARSSCMAGLRLPGLAPGGEQAGAAWPRRGSRRSRSCRARPASLRARSRSAPCRGSSRPARRAGRDVVGAAVELAQARIGFGREGGHDRPDPRQRREPHPHQAVRLARRMRRHAVRRRRHEAGQGRHLRAMAAGLEAPAVIRAFEVALPSQCTTRPAKAAAPRCGQRSAQACTCAVSSRQSTMFSPSRRTATGASATSPASATGCQSCLSIIARS